MPDLAIVSKQLSRRNIRPFKVRARCPARFPMVIENKPFSKDAVFTTLYWLTCPRLIRRISRLESDGWIGRLERTVAGSPELSRNMQNLHNSYALRRRRAIQPARPSGEIRSPRAVEALERTGVGGIADPSHLKCLHAHAAYHVVHGDHPLFVSFPELLTDVSDCRDCERLEVSGAV